MKILKIGLMCIIALTILSCTPSIPQVSKKLKNAIVETKSDKLIVNTGRVSRTYQLTSLGLKTISYKDLTNNQEWIANTINQCDWQIGAEPKAIFKSINVNISDDEKFTDEHLSTEIIFEYPTEKISLRYVIWVYPNSTGIRTQIQLMALEGFDSSKDKFAKDITERLNLKSLPNNGKAFGYMQGIKTNMPIQILTEKNIEANSTIDWANGLVFTNSNDGIILIKESNKHTRLGAEQDVATGGFTIDKNSVSVTGAGMYPKNLRTDKYLSSWANWSILYTGTEAEGNLALKMFDRRRYPVHEDRDIFMMANTWGTEDMRPECLYAAREDNVLKELESVAELGIDILQIDDGWQDKNWMPAITSKQHPHKDVLGNYEIYPQGWKNVTAKAKKLNVKLGLWAAWTIPLDKLILNYDNGKFSNFKLDFAQLNTIEKRDELMGKARELIKHSDYKTCVNWDVTEDPARAGYFYGREYGNVYLENRKITTQRPVVQYVPHKVLQDAWLLSKYININKFQVTIQNIDMTKDTAATDAKKHNHAYITGIALMSSPIFFQETHFYSDKAKEEIKPLLSVYKKHRLDMYKGYVFPIGDMPDNTNWTGFQNYNLNSESGYLTIFRELKNKETTKTLHLKFIGNNKIKLTDLLTDKEEILQVKNGDLSFSIAKSPEFKFYKYEIIKK